MSVDQRDNEWFYPTLLSDCKEKERNKTKEREHREFRMGIRRKMPFIEELKAFQDIHSLSTM